MDKSEILPNSPEFAKMTPAEQETILTARMAKTAIEPGQNKFIQRLAAASKIQGAGSLTTVKGNQFSIVIINNDLGGDEPMVFLEVMSPFPSARNNAKEVALSLEDFKALIAEMQKAVDAYEDNRHGNP